MAPPVSHISIVGTQLSPAIRPPRGAAQRLDKVESPKVVALSTIASLH